MESYMIQCDYSNFSNEQINRVIEYNSYIESLKMWLDFDNVAFYKKYKELAPNILNTKNHIGSLIIEMFSEGNIMHFKNGVLEYQHKKRFWVIITEILINEEYYHEADSDTPYIIDAGANIGLAIFYFKELYPNAIIDAFEPVKCTFSVLSRNVDRNGWKNVSLHNNALDISERETKIIVPTQDYLGASLTQRAYEYKDKEKIEEQTVKTIPLSPFLNKPVDFLKMDIEGLEETVLNESKDYLQNVHYLFVEYHFSKKVKNNNFVKILRLLECKKFEVSISKSIGYYQSTIYRPMNYVGKRYSINIWAKQKNYPIS